MILGRALGALIAAGAGLPSAAAQEETGGSNYVIVDPDLGRLRGDRAWRDPGIFVPPACAYDRSAGTVDEDLRRMRAGGQRKMALVVWHMHHANGAECAGFTVASNGGRLPERVLRNLATLLERAAADGYDEVQVRFAPMGGNSPDRWKNWDEAKFAENWSVVRSTVGRLHQGKSPRLVFDLGVELAGRTCQSCPDYVTRMWRNYVAEFGPGGSYGFSVAAAPGRVARLVQALRAGGPLPDEIALDVYRDAGKAVARAAAEAKAAGIAEPRFLIQETYYGEPGTVRDMLGAAERSGARIRAVMQWPVTPGANRHISVPRSYGYSYGRPQR
ncbi:hypothetical protein [Stella sp.]|uniref:hypothetical protein n=1 Tax=Stella sp. TaxID=2912054 RepID=UPI0035B33B7D